MLQAHCTAVSPVWSGPFSHGLMLRVTVTMSLSRCHEGPILRLWVMPKVLGATAMLEAGTARVILDCVKRPNHKSSNLAGAPASTIVRFRTSQIFQDRDQNGSPTAS